MKIFNLKEFLISIVKNEIACNRHNNYLKGDKKTRKEMKFISPGPLVLDDQQKLVRIINDVTSIHFKDKPENLRDYDYDVLYPEVIYIVFIFIIFIMFNS